MQKTMARKDPNVEEHKRADRLGLLATLITIVLGLAVLIAAVWCIADLSSIATSNY